MTNSEERTPSEWILDRAIELGRKKLDEDFWPYMIPAITDYLDDLRKKGKL